MPNPNPSPKDRYSVLGDEPRAKKILSLRLPESLDAKIRKLPNMPDYVRRWIQEGYERDIENSKNNRVDTE